MATKGQFTVATVDIGHRFGHLEVIGVRVGEYVRCRCDCGVEKSVRIYRLLNRTTKSSACMNKKAPVHGHARAGTDRTPTYRSWAMMKTRCTNPNFPKYPQYGGRGITVCERWVHSFEAFLEDMGERAEGTTLHRLDNDGNYEPDNCVWAHTTQQARNKTTTKLITFDGRTQSLAAWAEEIGVNQFTLWNRLESYGWSVKDALTTPTLPDGKRKHPFKHTRETRAAHGDRMKAVFAERPELVEKFGKTISELVWITDGNKDRRVKPDKISDGWERGRVGIRKLRDT